MGRLCDLKNRTWQIEINVSTIRHVRKELDVNLLELANKDSQLLTRLADPVLLVDVLFVLCADQCRQAGVSSEEFGASLSFDNVEQGLDLILEGVANFSPRALRPAYQKVLEKARKFKTTQETEVARVVATPEFDAAMEAAMEKKLKEQATPPETPPTAVSSGVTS